MSEENSKPIAEIDDETYELIQQLFQLVRSGDAARLEALFARGFNAPNIRDGKGNSLLMLASYHGHLETTRVLLEHGADPQLANDMGQIPLAGAAFKGDAAMTRLLIDHGADVNARSPDGKTALMFAAMFDRVEIIDILLARGANASLKAADGATAESSARAMGAEAARKRLEERSRS
ncbi:MAG TPA: ankyrin repeat domain-containing protein [Pyrinomonadaceae bacterium]|jgi:ankyrin repeat protein